MHCACEVTQVYMHIDRSYIQANIHASYEYILYVRFMNEMRLVFLCEEGYHLAACGPDGKGGFAITNPKQWVLQHKDLVKFSLMTLSASMNAAADTFGGPIASALIPSLNPQWYTTSLLQHLSVETGTEKGQSLLDLTDVVRGSMVEAMKAQHSELKAFMDATFGTASGWRLQLGLRPCTLPDGSCSWLCPEHAKDAPLLQIHTHAPSINTTVDEVSVTSSVSSNTSLPSSPRSPSNPFVPLSGVHTSIRESLLLGLVAKDCSDGIKTRECILTLSKDNSTLTLSKQKVVLGLGLGETKTQFQTSQLKLVEVAEESGAIVSLYFKKSTLSITAFALPVDTTILDLVSYMQLIQHRQQQGNGQSSGLRESFATPSQHSGLNSPV